MNGRTNVTTGANIDILEVPLDPVTKFVAEEGTGKVLLSWTDPKDKYATPEGEMAQDPQQLVSVWSYTVIVRKEGSDPVDENDGVVIVSSSVRNQYVSTHIPMQMLAMGLNTIMAHLQSMRMVLRPMVCTLVQRLVYMTRYWQTIHGHKLMKHARSELLNRFGKLGMSMNFLWR